MKLLLASFGALVILSVWASPAAAIEKGTEKKAQQGKLKNGEYVWDPKAAPEGSVDIVINLGPQKLYVYRDGVLIGRSTISSGSKGRETPKGIYMILEKNLTHHSNKYHEASMPLMERLTWGGLAIHAGNLPGYPESHGCVHVPLDFAKKLYTVTQEGDTVLIADSNARASTTSAPNLLLAEPPAASPAPGAAPAGSPAAAATETPATSPPETSPAPGSATATPGPSPAASPEPEAGTAPGPSPSPAASPAPAGEQDTVWKPGDVPNGPVAIVFSSADKRVYVYRKGVDIGRAELGGPAAGHSCGNFVYVALAQTLPGGLHQWSLLGSGEGTPSPNLQDVAKGLTLPPEFRQHLRDIVVPGTTFILTDHPANPSKPSHPD